jgi:hypothetical protein
MAMKLKKPITAHGDEVTEITLKEPTGQDCRAVGGLPYSIAADETVSINAAVAMKYIGRCAGLPPSSVDQICPSDLNTLCWEIAGFFLSETSAT